MTLKLLRQLLKGCADDTRLKIIYVLGCGELNVKNICAVTKVSQSTISKHLAKLRLLKIVIDRREGNLVFYKLNRAADSPQLRINSFILDLWKKVDIKSKKGGK